MASNLPLQNHGNVSAAELARLPDVPEAALRWLVEADVSTLMRWGQCSRYDVVQAQKLARAELTARRLLAVRQARALPQEQAA